MAKYYKCIEDRQGDTWAVDDIMTADEWLECATDWAVSDGNDELIEYLDSLTEEELIRAIDDIWDITIVEWSNND